MATVVVSVSTKKQHVPASPAASGNVRYQLMAGATAVATITGGLPMGGPIEFPNVADGEYTITASRMSMMNEPLGDVAQSQPFTVLNTTEIDVPDVVSVTV